MSTVINQAFFKVGSNNLSSHRNLLSHLLKNKEQEPIGILNTLIENPTNPAVACLDIWIFTNASKIWIEFSSKKERFLAVKGRIISFFKDFCNPVQDTLVSKLLITILQKMGFHL